jgi:hypothetical protein
VGTISTCTDSLALVVGIGRRDAAKASRLFLEGTLTLTAFGEKVSKCQG